MISLSRFINEEFFAHLYVENTMLWQYFICFHFQYGGLISNFKSLYRRITLIKGPPKITATRK